MIILVQYSMMLLACLGAAETISSHDPPREKLQLVFILSLRVKILSLQERNVQFVNRPKNWHIHLDSNKSFICNVLQKYNWF